MNNLPLRRTTLHLAQRFRIDGDTFITEILLTITTCTQGLNYTLSSFFRPAYTQSCPTGSWDSQDERFSFGDRDGVLKMCGQ